MPIVLDVRSKADFDQWLKQQRDALSKPADAPPATTTASDAGTPTPTPAPSPGTQPPRNGNHSVLIS
jgi:heme/copper-type cytochrome/quinol oxidase subunit 2